MKATLLNIVEILKKYLPQNNMPEILFDSPLTNKEYNDKRQIFNTYYQFRPTAIVFCTNTQQVSEVIKLIRQYNYTGTLRIRSGGHDHEGECSATDSLVIDLSKMTKVDIKSDLNYATIQPGIMFIDLIKQMNAKNLGLPHGTCYSVRIAGFTFGGGWGPWTRQKGMGCESLAGVTIVLGDGSYRSIIDNKLIPEYKGQPVTDLNEEDRKLLWALRGGGGMSYGIITELIYKTFTMPDYTTKFTIAWEQKFGQDIPPAVDILKRWEELIEYNENPDLLGTNLKVVAKFKDINDTTPVEKSLHDCYFYGYYMGSRENFQNQQEFEENLLKIIEENWFPEDQFSQYNVNFEDSIEAVLSNNVTNNSGKLTAVSNDNRRKWSTFSAWDRIVKWDTEQEKHPLLESIYDTESLPPHFQAIPPEIDKPAPHKITSRFAIVTDDENLASQRRIKLIESLESNLLATEGENQGMNTYFTLGAITGAYYRDYDFNANQFPEGSSFAYKKCFYTVQYQAWWDNDGIENPKVQPYVNRAIDWLEVCRNYEIPATYGAFISFKDDSIPTRVYFQESYDRLKEIKEAYSQDPDNMLSSRKTII
ncbi:FAD-binding oxidoreductase [Chryseobacterium aquaticum]|uniref:FAD-binding oxidoreductase n=1 Tax=Chryseobacterium aquaticum TaxID=452084 RepID=A0A848N3I3_9FLAO|nr:MULTISPECIES: FAD-dependent oxidoreductase [Chryseobacterium]NMR33318.1 FAD-binding oxidoreductase [Chryseobacterium aquaticum]NRQ44750.1 FAD-binding protein [Chryseobacterium sp. C-204]